MIYLSFMPEITDTYEDIEKEYLFIIDISGSMTGRKLKETKRAVIECLKQLDNGDKFNIIPFESDFEAMNIDSIEFNETNMKKAIKYVENLDTLGGTEILAPIKFALYEKETNKIVLLFTDGQVGNEDEIIKFVENNISRSRIFPFGIDTNVNASFIRQLAKVGNGKAELIQPNEKIDDKIIRTFARIQTPLLEEIKVDYGKNKVINEIREDKCLFNYEFFNIFSKLEEISDDIILKGKILDKEYAWTISKEDIKNTNVDLEVLFAKLEMERLEEYIRNSEDNGKIEAYKKMIIDLAIKYNINSKYTSFITVYERENKLLDIPEYQDTPLSNKFAEDAMEDYETCADMGSPYENIVADAWRMRPSTSSNDNSGDLDIPCFLRKNKSTGSKNKSSTPYKGASIFNALRNKIGSASEKYCDEFDENEYEKSDYEICIEKIEEYYNIFKNNKDKSILTYLLYAVYYLEKQSDKFNYTDLLKFLEKNRDKILASELYMKLILLCYYKLA
ncbi:MAG: VWA domain-containing protein, partial [Clostridia bacterium]|nr:VWA domain-containing protein [Clostridia bacterium]